MPSRISITLLVCMLGAACAAGALFLPPREAAAPAPAPVATDPTSDQAATDVQVSIENFTFTSVGTLRPGQRIVVTNNDSVPHSLTADDGQFDTGLLQPGEQAAILAPPTPGDFSFFCAVHPAMTGSFTVTA